uniref:Serpentine receptor class gamma n=1 Tax=Panagrolaimus davidi TaxID=227884 RepID=A0A914P7N9_9BILA
MVSLSLNRFTSIFLITKHKTIWIKYFPFILTFLLIYPFIVGGFTFFTYSTCRIDIYAPECLNYFKADYYRSAISNGICAILSLIIGISTATFYKLKFTNEAKAQTRQLKIEHKLLLQSVWSASLFGFFAFLGVFYPYFYEKKDDPEFFVMNRIYGFVQDLAYISYHYLSIILLFVFS